MQKQILSEFSLYLPSLFFYMHACPCKYYCFYILSFIIIIEKDLNSEEEKVNLEDPAYDTRLLPAGDSCIVVDFGNIISIDINKTVQALRGQIQARPPIGITEMVPTYRSLAIYFDPVITDLEVLREQIQKKLHNLNTDAFEERRQITIPVCYGNDYGPDLPNVASFNGLTVEEVIRIHSETTYYCYMLGFTPGFPYLGGMDPSIATPRLDRPREKILAGSVGIADKQTGIYSVDSPGGWQIIGRTPLKLFDPQSSPPALLEAGMWVRFLSVSVEEFKDMLREKENCSTLIKREANSL